MENYDIELGPKKYTTSELESVYKKVNSALTTETARIVNDSFRLIIESGGRLEHTFLPSEQELYIVAIARKLNLKGDIAEIIEKIKKDAVTAA